MAAFTAVLLLVSTGECQAESHAKERLPADNNASRMYMLTSLVVI